MIKVVIFDIGDTLFETIRDKSSFYELYTKFLKKHKLNYSLKEIMHAHEFAYKTYNELENKEKELIYSYFETQFFLGLGITKNQKLAKLLNKDYTKYLMQTTILMPNAKEILIKLKKSGLILAVITNTHDELNRNLAKQYKIYKYFTHFLMSHEEGTIKSELKIFHLLLEKLNKNRKNKILPSECLMVGNNLNEDTAASQLGMKTAILTRKVDKNEKLQSFEPDYYIDDLSELVELVKKLNSEGV